MASWVRLARAAKPSRAPPARSASSSKRASRMATSRVPNASSSAATASSTSGGTTSSAPSGVSGPPLLLPLGSRLRSGVPLRLVAPAPACRALPPFRSLSGSGCRDDMTAVPAASASLMAVHKWEHLGPKAITAWGNTPALPLSPLSSNRSLSSAGTALLMRSGATVKIPPPFSSAAAALVARVRASGEARGVIGRGCRIPYLAAV
mmetsp:Transcript_25844/g.70097  ORF Transcript_25844/g.70097 Transcript_25844/m.70097 type:complete len:206 (+) Transcript_25844:1561-2178(+)